MMIEKEKNFISAVVYVRNKESVIKQFVEGVADVLKENFENSEIILVDDFSNDGSMQIIKDLKKKLSGISMSIVHMSSFHGLEGAMQAGVDLAIGDFVLEFDKPWLDFEPKLIMTLYNRCLAGNDIVFACPENKVSWRSKCFYALFEKFSAHRTKMNSDFFKIISRRGINRVQSLYKTIPYRKALYLNCGLKTDNVFFTRKMICDTESKEIRKENYKTGLNSLMIFTDFAVKASMTVTFIMMFLALAMGVYVLTDYFVFESPISGWASIMLFLSIGFFGLFLILSIILKYLSLSLEISFKDRKYLIEDIEKL